MTGIRKSTVTLPKPNPGVVLAGFAPGRVAKGIGEDLKANLVMFCSNNSHPIVVGCIDTLFVSKVFLADLTKRIGNIKILLFATHTHSAPSLAADLPLFGRLDQGWYAQVLDVLANEIISLQKAPIESVTISYGDACTNLNINRRKSSYVFDYPKLKKGVVSFGRKISSAPNPSGIVDSRIRLFVFENNVGVAAIIWSFAAHAAYFPKLSVSPDFPGLIASELRRMYGENCCIIFAPGFTGSSIPNVKTRFLRPWRQMVLSCLPFYPVLPDVSIGEYTAWIKKLTEKVVSAIEARKESSTPMSCFQVREARLPAIFRDHSGRELDLNLLYLKLSPDLGIFACNGEMLSEWTEILQRSANGKVIFSGYAGGDCLYVPTTDEIKKGGYEVDRFQYYFGLNGTFSTSISEDVTSTVTRMLGS